MKREKEIKIIIAGVIFFTLPLTMYFVFLTIKNGGFAFGLLWDVFIITMIGIGITVIYGVVVYLLSNWIEK